MMIDEHERPVGCSLEAYLQEPGLPEGQRRRLRLFQAVESGVCSRIERFCTENGLEVTDLAVLLVAPEAHPLFEGTLEVGDGGSAGARRAGLPPISVILGHRERLRAFLCAVLPKAEDAAFDPYGDLLEPAPARCVRVLIVDDESLTVMSYGTFVTLRMDVAQMPQA